MLNVKICLHVNVHSEGMFVYMQVHCGAALWCV